MTTNNYLTRYAEGTSLVPKRSQAIATGKDQNTCLHEEPQMAAMISYRYIVPSLNNGLKKKTLLNTDRRQTD